MIHWHGFAFLILDRGGSPKAVLDYGDSDQGIQRKNKGENRVRVVETPRRFEV